MPISRFLAALRRKVGHDLLQMPCVGAVIRDERGRILLQRRSDNGRWALPGGAIDPGESHTQAVVREAREETGLDVRPQRVLGVVGSLRNVYPNGDEVDVTLVIFGCELVGGELACADGEALELAWFEPQNLPKMHYPPQIFDEDRREAYFETNV